MRRIVSVRAAGIACAGLVILFYYLLLTTFGTFDLAYVSKHGHVFDSMAFHLLQGRLDVDPGSIGDEAFVREGRTYAYFGIVPALLRMPILPFVDTATMPLEASSRFTAMIAGAAGQLVAILAFTPAMPSGSLRGLTIACLGIAAAVSGPAIMLSMAPSIFVESVLWSWAFASWFLAALAPMMLTGSSVSPRRLAAAAIFAGLCLNTRASTGLGLFLALGAVMAWRLVTTAVLSGDLRIARGAARRTTAQFLAPVLIGTAFVALACAVNYGRWGSPWTTMPAELHALASVTPGRLERLATYGLFNSERLWLGVIYYFVPIWAFTRDGRYLFHDEIERLFDGFELPPSSFLLSDPLTMGLATIGIFALLRRGIRGVDRVAALAALGALAVPSLMMLVAWYMAFRYRVEFMPLFFLGSCFGAVRIGERLAAARPGPRRAALAGLTLLLVLQLASAHLHAVLVAVSPFGPSDALATDGIVAFYRARLTPS